MSSERLPRCTPFYRAGNGWKMVQGGQMIPWEKVGKLKPADRLVWVRLNGLPDAQEIHRSDGWRQRVLKRSATISSFHAFEIPSLLDSCSAYYSVANGWRMSWHCALGLWHDVKHTLNRLLIFSTSEHMLITYNRSNWPSRARCSLLKGLVGNDRPTCRTCKQFNPEN